MKTCLKTMTLFILFISGMSICGGQTPSYAISNPPFFGNLNLTYHPTTNTSARTSASAGLCDEADIRIFPSESPQSEVHISINPNNPQNLVVSANTYTDRYQQGRYVSNDYGLSWYGSDALII